MYTNTAAAAASLVAMGLLPSLALGLPSSAPAERAAAAAAPIVAPAMMRRAPLITPPRAVPGKFIIKMMSSESSVSAMDMSAMDMAISSIAADADAKLENFNGFVASLSDDEVELLRDNSMVEYIEQDAVVSHYASEEGAPWGIARLSNTEPGSTTYTYDESAGEGVCAYVLDTGIDITHPEFEGRAEWLANFADDADEDGYGHGTHVSGTIGSVTYGVSKKVTLFAVKVLDNSGSGTNSGVIQGMEYVVTDSPDRDCPNGVVVNMSLGGSASTAVNTAAAAIVSAGHFLGVAAGNSAADASTFSPASEPTACTVGATDDTDTLAYYSNFGSLVDILAPGSDVLSTLPNDQTGTESGTSMATPHVVGLAAYFLGLGAVTDASAACDYIVSQAQNGAISGVPNGTVNAIVQNGEAA